MAGQKVKAVYEILTAVYGQSPWTLEQIVADMDKPDSDYYFAYQGERVVGFLALQALAGELEITNIAVHPDFQKQGLADQLMAHLADYDMPVFLEVRASNYVAQQLYAKHDFTAVGKRKDYYANPTEDAVIMVRD